jgi:hypothetical protein
VAAAAREREAEARGDTIVGPGSGGDRDDEVALLRQIRKDLPRTQLRAGTLPNAKLLVEDDRFQSLMERVLFVWALRQPASGYVQGLNDVLLPLILVFLADQGGGQPLSGLDPQLLDSLGEETLADVEADVYWCVSKILSEIYDHYTHGQPGIQRMVQRLKDIIQRIDASLARHLEAQDTDLLHTAFRWITCLMVRELPVSCCIRLWDALISESAQAATAGQPNRRSVSSAGFETLLVYFCACFTAYFSSRLQAMDFEAITLFLQKMPTDHFKESDVEVLLSEAYVLKSLFEQAPKHLSG